MIDFNAIADEFGTPVYVYDLAVVERQIERLRPFDVIRFAQKACSNLAMLDFMRRRGVLVDAVSEGEVRRALAAGFRSSAGPSGSGACSEPPAIVYTSDVFTPGALSLLSEEQIHVNVGSPDMIWQWGQAAPGSSVTLRINPGFGHGHSQKTNTGGEHSKHGIWREQLDECLQMTQQFNLAVSGLHMHIGSGSDFEHLAQVVDAMESAALEVGRSITTISAGGGLPVPYREDEEPIDCARYFELWDALRKRLAEQFGHPLRLEIEPGRFLTAECGVLVTEVLGVKATGDNTFYMVDAGFNQLARPAMYGAYHPISVCSRRPDERRTQRPAVIAGPLCESGDVFTQREGGFVEPRELPKAHIGERLAIGVAGAYGAVMSSNYNSFPRAAEVAVYQDQRRLIRHRETFADLVRGEVIPDWT